MNLKLTKPLVFFDIESTGMNIAKDRIVEIAFLKIFPDSSQESKLQRINPEIPIPEETTRIHGISDEDVENSPTFKQVAKKFAGFIEGCDLAGFNSNRFDIPMLAEEFIRADVDVDLKRHKNIDVQVIFHKMEQRTLSAAYKFYCKKKLVDAHSAMADTSATFEILDAQIQHYNALKADVDYLSDFSAHKKNADFAGRIVYNDKQQEVFNFGKYKNMPVEDVLSKDPSYYGWMMKGDFPLYTKKVLTNIKLRAMKNKK
ncbi:MAG: 3'-5' exonuclease [Candidatus Delongbacteria bacterium]|jgi:DNA polymerase-3 subunit epsilon|nr:3'-5' exonuclease [Candidatus Delongbacteria bacterium]